MTVQPYESKVITETATEAEETTDWNTGGEARFFLRCFSRRTIILGRNMAEGRTVKEGGGGVYSRGVQYRRLNRTTKTPLPNFLCLLTCCLTAFPNLSTSLFVSLMVHSCSSSVLFP